MKTKEIALLKKQISKLSAEDFDLEAWKTGSMILLERLFGPENQKMQQMAKIKYDQSSWALREAKGTKNMMETCKKQGKEIMDIAIDELTNFGQSSDVEDQNAALFRAVIIQALEDELKISEYRALVTIINSDKELEIKKQELIAALNTAGHDATENVLSSILLAEQTRKHL